MLLIATIYACFTCLLWCALYIVGTVAIIKNRSFEDLSSAPACPPAPALAPKPVLSIIIPARNEEEGLAQALGSLQRQAGGVVLEVIVINDRSTDRTGEIIDALARTDPRIRPLHITALPEGWLGKVHALDQGARAARGRWLLFTDADVEFGPDCLCRAVDYAESNRLDHLVLFPAINAHGFWLDATINAFLLLYLLGTKAFKKDGSATVGAGAFNMVKREAFDRTPGFEWLRLETADDVGLALMLKHAGARRDFAPATTLLGVSWYKSLGAMVTGLEKNLFGAVADYRYAKSMAALTLTLAFALGPLAASILALQSFWAMAAALLTLGALTAYASAVRYMLGQRFWATLAAPAGYAIIAYILMRSTLKCWREGGIRWRDTLYDIEELRKGKRVKF